MLDVWVVHEKCDGDDDDVTGPGYAGEVKWAAVDRLDESLSGEWHQLAVIIYADTQQKADRRAVIIAKAFNEAHE